MKTMFMLPFDHRSGFARELLNKAYPVSASDDKKISSLKRVIYQGFLLAREEVLKIGDPCILVDEEFGGDIILDAQKKHIPVAVTTEQSGASSFRFIHGRGFGRQLAKIRPDFAKALVHYTQGDNEMNSEKRSRLKELAHFCEEEHIPLLLEVLLHGKSAPAKQMVTMMREFHRDGIRPAVWKLEGLQNKRDWKNVARAAQAPIIVLGRGQGMKEVEAWIRAAAQSGYVDGFAIGRTIFLQPLQDLLEKKITRKIAAEHIAKRYLHFVKLWKKEAR